MTIPPEVSDGNGGTLDPLKISQRESLAILHVKLDDHRTDYRAFKHDVEQRLRNIQTRLDVNEGATRQVRRLFATGIAAIGALAAVTAAVVYVIIAARTGHHP